TNIHVSVRCRGRNDKEIAEDSPVIITTSGESLNQGKELAVQTGSTHKIYAVDNVFGADADQMTVYDTAVSSMIGEVLTGYNCTIFAYGQTGTGKTHTMAGDLNELYLSDNSGIAPRAIFDLFSRLPSSDDSDDDPDYLVKCSYVELYNEELKDLLTDSTDQKLKLYDDPARKSTVIQGAEEIYIRSAVDGLKLLQNGAQRRQVAATKMNDVSSRSHTIFTVTVVLKDPINTSEESVRVGKLNIVDLAGSENIKSSGAENKRAREAGMINQSLLTLGRVINALVAKSAHVPYRESKLTRILQDSLGGRTQTCIIATISPAACNMEETLSTLDYASRAKDIKNKPQMNHTFSKKTLIKKLILEIEQLKGDLSATRQKNGVYLSQQSYDSLLSDNERKTQTIEEQQMKITLLEGQLASSRKHNQENSEQLSDTQKRLQTISEEHQKCNQTVSNLETNIEKLEAQLKEEIDLRLAQANNEGELGSIAEKQAKCIETMSIDIDHLQDALERRNLTNSNNKAMWLESRTQVLGLNERLLISLKRYTDLNSSFTSQIPNKLSEIVKQQKKKLAFVDDSLKSIIATFNEAWESQKEKDVGLNEKTVDMVNALGVFSQKMAEELSTLFDDLSNAIPLIEKELSALDTCFSDTVIKHFDELTSNIKEAFGNLESYYTKQDEEMKEIRKYISSSRETISVMETASVGIAYAIQNEGIRAEMDRQAAMTQIADILESLTATHTKRLDGLIKNIGTDLEHTCNTF
ncbi:hypothetical protein CANCADRAFT_19537, partial [Tortispora caseinolytica NRRL Y-17796]